MSKLIKNNDFIRNKLEECIDLKVDGNDLVDLFEVSLHEEYLSVELLKTLKKFWNENKEEKLYINQLLSTTELYLPCLKPAQRDPLYDQKIQELKAQLDEDAYQKMVYNVDLNSPLRFNNDNKSKSGTVIPDFKTLQGQLIAVINTFAVIIGAFFFGYKAVQYSLDEPNISKQMFGGFFLAIIVAIADFYFLFKKLMSLDQSFDTKKETKQVIPKKKATKQSKKSNLDKKQD